MLDDNYIDQIPTYTKAAIDRWVKEACPVGGFLTAVLCNNLKEALGRADVNNGPVIQAIVGYLYNECPSSCWGSKAKVDSWQGTNPHTPLQ